MEACAGGLEQAAADSRWIMSKTAGNDVKQRVKSTWREGPVSMDAGDGAVTIRPLLFLLINTVADLT